MDERYKDLLSLVCRQSAILEQYYGILQRGEAVDEEKLIHHLELLAYAKEALLEKKKELGYQDGLAFMEDANFAGFRYSNGCLTGNYDKLPDVVIPFLESDEDAHFRYEVGVLLLSHYLMQKGEYDTMFTVESFKKKQPWYCRVRLFLQKVFRVLKKKMERKEVTAA